MLSKVLELEQQHSTALQELSHTYTAEKEQLIGQHHLQLQVCVSSMSACVRIWHLQGESTSNAQPGKLFLNVFSGVLVSGSYSPLERGLHRVVVHPL